MRIQCTKAAWNEISEDTEISQHTRLQRKLLALYDLWIPFLRLLGFSSLGRGNACSFKKGDCPERRVKSRNEEPMSISSELRPSLYHVKWVVIVLPHVELSPRLGDESKQTVSRKSRYSSH
ncbi:hypothetical protein FRC02_005403 [Tulasnella sp. 418]|nr:hypothetical protein FRC02_005403 [Tulasnella sp. 418]